MFSLENKTVLVVIAHPDDEVIFGWPILQETKAKILCCSSDLNNPERTWCKHRKFVLEKICNYIGVETLKCLDYNSEFYRMQTRNEDLKKMSQHVVSSISEMEPFDYIYTHNFWGEYGHLDHILINNICMSLQKKIIVSDMFVKSNWMCYPSKPRWLDFLGKNQSVNVSLDEQFYGRLESMYRAAGVWTWNQEAVKKCSLTILENES